MLIWSKCGVYVYGYGKRMLFTENVQSGLFSNRKQNKLGFEDIKYHFTQISKIKINWLWETVLYNLDVFIKCITIIVFKKIIKYGLSMEKSNIGWSPTVWSLSGWASNLSVGFCGWGLHVRRAQYWAVRPAWHMVPITFWWVCRGKKANPYWPFPSRFAQAAIHQILREHLPPKSQTKPQPVWSGQAAYTWLLRLSEQTTQSQVHSTRWF